MKASTSIACPPVSDNGSLAASNFSTSRPLSPPKFPVPHASGHSTLYSIGRAAKILGVSPGTLRLYCDAGQIECLVLPSRHRRVSLRAIDAFNGVLEDDGETSYSDKEKVVIYARVSSFSQDAKGQDGKSSLERQINRLLSEVSAREGVPEGDIRVFKDVASSFGDREGLNRLIDAVIDGSVRRVYCLFLDRLSRVPALTRLIEHLCQRFGVEIIALDVEDSEGQEVWQKELLNYITVWCNRQSAQKSIMVTRKEISPECLNRIVELRQKGHTIRAIYEKLKKEGHKTKTGMGVEDEVSYMKIRMLLDENGVETVLTKVLVGVEAKIDSTCREFIEGKIQQGEYQERISVKSVYPAYERFCELKKRLPQPRNVFGRVMVKVLGKHDVKSHGVCQWRGYKVLD